MNTTRFLTVTVALLYCFFWIAVAGAAVYLTLCWLSEH